MYNNDNSFTVSGKNRIPAGSDSINIIMVRLNKMQPCLSETGKPGSLDGNSINSNSLLIFVPGHKSRNSNVSNRWLKIPGEQYKKIKSRGSSVLII